MVTLDFYDVLDVSSCRLHSLSYYPQALLLIFIPNDNSHLMYSDSGKKLSTATKDK